MTSNSLYARLIHAGFSLRVADYRYDFRKRIFVWFVDEDDCPILLIEDLYVHEGHGRPMDDKIAILSGYPRNIFEGRGSYIYDHQDPSTPPLAFPKELQAPALADWMNSAFSRATPSSILERKLSKAINETCGFVQRLEAREIAAATAPPQPATIRKAGRL